MSEETEEKTGRQPMTEEEALVAARPLAQDEPTPGTNEEITETVQDPAVDDSLLIVPERDKDAVLPEVDPQDVNELPEYPAAVKTEDRDLDNEQDRSGFSAEVPEGWTKPRAVKYFQDRLKAKGYNLEYHGHVDERTREAVKQYNKDHDLGTGSTITQKVWDHVVGDQAVVARRARL